MRTLYKRVCASLAVVVCVSFVIGCSTTDPSDEGEIRFTASIDNELVTSEMKASSDAVQGGSTVDSIRIVSVKVLISRLLMLSTKESDDSVANDDNRGRAVKSGPLVVTFSRDSSAIALATPIPSGSYSRVKLEKHKFTPSEAATYVSNPTFAPFCQPERVTMIVSGWVYTSTEGERSFEFTSDATENFWLWFTPPLQVAANGTVEVALRFDAAKVFRSLSGVLNPFDDKDRRVLSTLLESGFSVKRRP